MKLYLPGRGRPRGVKHVVYRGRVISSVRVVRFARIAIIRHQLSVHGFCLLAPGFEVKALAEGLAQLDTTAPHRIYHHRVLTAVHAAERMEREHSEIDIGLGVQGEGAGGAATISVIGVVYSASVYQPSKLISLPV